MYILSFIRNDLEKQTITEVPISPECRLATYYLLLSIYIYNLLLSERWQFPCSWAAVDGCDLPLKWPPGQQTTAKEYRNFKMFYCCSNGCS